MLEPFCFSLDCVDTPGWIDRDGDSCDEYRRYYCHDGASNVGSKYNYPEINCCGCGKENKG